MSTQYDPLVRDYGYLRGYDYPIVIPDGTTVRDKNFSQEAPGTEAIIQGSGLVFEFCNLTNVLVNPAWTLVATNTMQVRVDGDDVYRVYPDGHEELISGGPQ
tara:strand:- start:1388 stop:1693 length:306 start_codon:yes stop_codon:yes gene_type:complete